MSELRVLVRLLIETDVSYVSYHCLTSVSLSIDFFWQISNRDAIQRSPYR